MHPDEHLSPEYQPRATLKAIAVERVRAKKLPPITKPGGWRDVYELTRDIVVGIALAFGLPTVMLILIVALLGGCRFVSEGSTGYEPPEDPELASAKGRCGDHFGCFGADTEGSESEDDGADSGAETVAGSSSDDGASSTSLSDPSESTGGEPDLFGPCDECSDPYAPADFFEGCVCTAMCLSDEDCDTGVCDSVFSFCVEPCASDEDCRDGAVCQMHEGVENFCVWPSR